VLAVPPVDLYVRVSRVGGRENLTSPEDQERQARAFAASQGLTIGKVLTDLDESGGTLDRPALVEALRRVEARESGGIVVAYLSRASRDTRQGLELLERVTRAGGSVYAPNLPNYLTADGKMLTTIQLAVDAGYRERKGEELERAKENAVALGIPINSRPATGYVKGADRRLTPDPVSAPVVVAVFEARTRGAGPAELAELLEASGVTTSQGSRTWSKEAVYGLLRNRVYLGEISYGRDRRFVNVAAHEAIVDLATWQLAQGGARRVMSRERVNLLAGLLRCSGCRHCLQGTSDAHKHRIYRCKRRHAGGICERPARNRAEPVEAAVLSDLWEHLPPISARGRRDARGRLALLASAAEQERRALAQWASPQMQAEIGDLDVYVAGMRDRRERAAAAEARLAAEQRLQRDAHAFPEAQTVREAWDRATVASRAAFVATQYDCIQLGRNPDLLIVYPRGVGPAGLPRQGFRRDPVLRPFDLGVPDGARELSL
jgi:DNA invertase Pin-like site-specific DNA recombinase